MFEITLLKWNTRVQPQLLVLTIQRRERISTNCAGNTAVSCNYMLSVRHDLISARVKSN